MNSRTILIVVAALAAVALIASIGFKGLHLAGGLFAQKDDTPTIMIVTDDMVKEAVTTQVTEVALNAALNAVAPAPAAAPGDKAKPAGKAPDAGKSADQPKANLGLLTQSLQDPFAGTLGADFQQSGRFNLIPTPKIKEQLEKYDREGGHTETKKGIFSVTSDKMHAMSSHGSSSSDKVEVAAGTVTEQAEMPTGGLTQAAQKLDARYVLLVSMTIPDQDFQYMNTGGTITMTAQPIVNYEIYDARNGHISFRKSEQLAKPISEVVEDNGDFPRSRLATFYKLRMRLNHAASLFVLNNVLQELAPPRITEAGSQIVINRGANDGVQAGAIYSVERETGSAEREGVNDKGQGGHDLERVRVPVGQIRIDRAQQKIAVASAVSGGPFTRNDVVMFTGGLPAAGGAGGAPADTVALGSRALSQADMKGGPPLRQASLAIDQIVLGDGKAAADSVTLSRAIASALQKDRRITVLSRKDLNQVLQERRMNQRSTGDGGSLAEGLRTAGYVIVGEFHGASARHNKTLSVGGETTTVSSSVSTSLSGTLRALSTDGTLVESVDVSVNSSNLEDLANAAARALLLKLFPMKVVQVDVAQGIVRLNRGEDAGLRPGSHVRIYSLGEKIVDPQTGTLLSEGARTLVGEIVLTQVDPAISTGRFAGPPFQVAVGYDALPGGDTGAAATKSGGAAKPAKPHKAAKPEAEVRF